MEHTQNQVFGAPGLRRTGGLITLLLSLLLGGCSPWETAVNKAPLDRHYATFQRAEPLPGTSVSDALSSSKSALEAIGYEVQSVTAELRMIRTKPRSVLTTDTCDCGTWNKMQVAGFALGTLVVTVDPHGADATVSVDFECEMSFTGTDYLGFLIPTQEYRCASRGRQEVEFWKMLHRIAEVRKQRQSGPGR